MIVCIQFVKFQFQFCSQNFILWNILLLYFTVMFHLQLLYYILKFFDICRNLKQLKNYLANLIDITITYPYYEIESDFYDANTLINVEIKWKKKINSMKSIKSLPNTVYSRLSGLSLRRCGQIIKKHGKSKLTFFLIFSEI